MKHLLLSFLLALATVATLGFHTQQRPPKKPAPPDTTRVDSALLERDQRIDTMTTTPHKPGKPRPTAPDTTRAPERN